MLIIQKITLWPAQAGSRPIEASEWQWSQALDHGIWGRFELSDLKSETLQVIALIIEYRGVRIWG